VRAVPPRATNALAIGTLVVSGLLIATGLNDYAAIGAGFIPARVVGVAMPAGLPFVLPVWMTPLGATLVHASWVHLGMNLLMLVYCGREAEKAVGWRGIAVLYVVGAYVAAAGQWALSPYSVEPMVGASGAISALLAAYAMLFGQRRAKAIGPFSGKVVHMAWLAAAWVGVQALVGFAGLGGMRIAIGAHIGGFLAGLVLTKPLLHWRFKKR
jgi:membrane associated rhomboid family serine protease